MRYLLEKVKESGYVRGGEAPVDPHSGGGRLSVVRSGLVEGEERGNLAAAEPLICEEADDLIRVGWLSAPPISAIDRSCGRAIPSSMSLCNILKCYAWRPLPSKFRGRVARSVFPSL